MKYFIMFDFIVNGPWYIIPAIIIAMLVEVIIDYERIERHTDMNQKYLYLLTVLLGSMVGISILLLL